MNLAAISFRGRAQHHAPRNALTPHFRVTEVREARGVNNDAFLVESQAVLGYRQALRLLVATVRVAVKPAISGIEHIQQAVWPLDGGAGKNAILICRNAGGEGDSLALPGHQVSR